MSVGALPHASLVDTPKQYCMAYTSWIPRIVCCSLILCADMHRNLVRQAHIIRILKHELIASLSLAKAEKGKT